jgi:transcriptional regulator with PAS, ATPase and Fis domain
LCQARRAREDPPLSSRELDNEIERAVALAEPGEPIGPAHLSERIRTAVVMPPLTLAEAIERLKRRMIEDALRECGSKTRAAERLGLSRQSLQQMLRRLQREARRVVQAPVSVSL